VLEEEGKKNIYIYKTNGREEGKKEREKIIKINFIKNKYF